MADSNILRTFRVDSGEWEKFLLICDKHNISASAAIKEYISKVNESEKLVIPVKTPKQSNDAIADIQKQLRQINDRLEALEKVSQ